MTQPHHLPDDALAALAAGGAASESEAAHLASCPDCARGLGNLRRVRELLLDVEHVDDAEPLPEPERVVRAAREASRRTRPCPRLERATERAMPAASLRDALSSTVRWVFTAGELEVSVQALQDARNRRRIVGQVLRGELGGADLLVHLRGAGPDRFEVTDRWGGFDLGPVPAAELELLLEADEGVWLLALRSSENDRDRT